MATVQGDITRKGNPTHQLLDPVMIPGPIGLPGGMNTHIVKEGETLQGIARTKYGDSGLWPQIFYANQGVLGVNHGQPTPGQTLIIP